MYFLPAKHLSFWSFQTGELAKLAFMNPIWQQQVFLTRKGLRIAFEHPQLKGPFSSGLWFPEQIHVNREEGGSEAGTIELRDLANKLRALSPATGPLDLLIQRLPSPCQ